MPSPVQLLRGGKPGRTASDDRDGFSCPHPWFLGLHPPFFKGGLDNGALIVLRGYRLFIQIAGTGRFAESRADSAGKFRKTVRLAQTQISLFPVSCIHQVVGLRHQVMKGTAGRHSADHHPRLAERHAAGHAPGSLKSLFFSAHGNPELMEIRNPDFGIQRFCRFSFVI